MSTVSPFDGLRISRDLVCEFFAVFSRFEFTLKESRFIRTNRGRAEPNWRAFAQSVAQSLRVAADSDRELFYRNGNRMMAVEITTEPTFSAGTPRLLFEGNSQPSVATPANYDVAPDGQRFLMIREGGPDSEPNQINVVLNWFEELKQRVPTGN